MDAGKDKVESKALGLVQTRFLTSSREAGANSPNWKATCCQSVSHRRRGFLNCYYAPLNHFQNIKQSDLIISGGSRTNRPLTNTQPTQFAVAHADTYTHTHSLTHTNIDAPPSEVRKHTYTHTTQPNAPESAVAWKDSQTTEHRLSASSHAESDPLQLQK